MFGKRLNHLKAFLVQVFFNYLFVIYPEVRDFNFILIEVSQSRFLITGKYHKCELIDLHRKIKEEFGPISKLPGMLGNKEILLVTDPTDFEMVFRTEGIWPNRRGIATFDHYRKEVRPDIFKNLGGLIKTFHII